MRRSIVLLAVALGCEAEDEWFPESSYVMDTIEGRDWYGGLQLRFRGRQLQASAGCNGMSGHYRLRDGELVVPPYVGRPDGGCGPVQLHEQDSWMEEFLYAGPSYELEGPELTLSDEVVTIVLVDEAIADLDRPLVGPTWLIQATFAEGTVEVWDYDNTATLEFSADGHVEIIGRCALGTADYVTDGELLTFTEIAIDPSQCPEHDPAGFIDEHLRALLVLGPLTYAINAGELVISSGNFGIVLRTR